jgi:hypothetical protein
MKSGNAFNGTNTVYDLAHRIQLSNKKSKKKNESSTTTERRIDESLANLKKLVMCFCDR